MRFGSAMLRRAAVALTLAAGLLAVARPAEAQQGHYVVAVCGTMPVNFVAGRTTAPAVVNVTGQLCISGTINATSTARATAAAPSYIEGSDNPFSMDLSGNLRTLASVSVTFPTIGAAVPATGIYSAVNIGGNLTGTTGGTTAADNVTSPTGALDTRSFNFVYDGTNWDRLYGDSTNGAFVNVKTSVLPTGAATAAKQPALGTAGTASTDVITVQGIASMTPLLVSQATAANLNATVVGTGTFVTQSTLAAETTKVIGTVRNVGNVGGVFDAVVGAAPPANVLQVGANASGATGGLIKGLIQCDSSAIYDASTSGSTELVALTSGRTIYICGYSILAGGTVNVKFIYGTGTACATSPANMTPAFQLTAQAGIADGATFFRGLKTASANAFCINTSAGIAVQAIVYYAIL